MTTINESERMYSCHRCEKPVAEQNALVLQPHLLRKRLAEHLPSAERAKFWIRSEDMHRFILCGDCARVETRKHPNDKAPVASLVKVIERMREREVRVEAEAKTKADKSLLAFEALADRKLEVTEEQMTRLIRHHLEARPAAEGEKACPRCGCAIRPDKAWVPSLDVIGGFLARRVQADDLPNFAVCGACGNFLREIVKVATFRYIGTREMLEANEAAEKLERKAAEEILKRGSLPLSASLGAIADVAVKIDRPEDDDEVAESLSITPISSSVSVDTMPSERKRVKPRGKKARKAAAA